MVYQMSFRHYYHSSYWSIRCSNYYHSSYWSIRCSNYYHSSYWSIRCSTTTTVAIFPSDVQTTTDVNYYRSSYFSYQMFKLLTTVATGLSDVHNYNHSSYWSIRCSNYSVATIHRLIRYPNYYHCNWSIR